MPPAVGCARWWDNAAGAAHCVCPTWQAARRAPHHRVRRSRRLAAAACASRLTSTAWLPGPGRLGAAHKAVTHADLGPVLASGHDQRCGGSEGGVGPPAQAAVCSAPCAGKREPVSGGAAPLAPPAGRVQTNPHLRARQAHPSSMCWNPRWRTTRRRQQRRWRRRRLCSGAGTSGVVERARARAG